MKAISVLALLAVMTTSAVPIYKPACTCELNKHNQCVITVKQKEKDLGLPRQVQGSKVLLLNKGQNLRNIINFKVI